MDLVNIWKLVGVFLYTVLVLVSQGSASDSVGDNPIVETSLGQVRGKTVSIPRFIKQAHIFHNIPFAAPPIGKLRFLPPQPVTPWEGIRDGTTAGPACLQLANYMKHSMIEFLNTCLDLYPEEEQVTSEDCLQLNVYTPDLNGSKPVMVYMHGGGYASGWASAYDMRGLAIAEDVVGVTIQYRVGPLGWLSTPDGTVEGNMGFQDQVAALQWVQNNIAKFGGDPGKVTIFGQSAGSMTAHMHMLSPLSQGLFHRAILLSGSMQDPNLFLAHPHGPEKALEALAKDLDCPLEDTSKLLHCLQEAPAEQFYFDLVPNPLSLPRVDGKILPDIPSELLKSGNYNSGIDVIAGIDQVEGYLVSKILDPGFQLPDVEYDHFRNYARGLVSSLYPVNKNKLEKLTKAVMSTYSKGPYQDDLKKGFMDFNGDAILTGATYKTASMLAKRETEKTFFYEFRYRSDFSTTPDYVISDHGSELYFVFGYPSIRQDRKEETPAQIRDRLTGVEVMRYFANFARSGDPNGEGLAEWPQFKDGSYLVLEAYPYVKQNYQEERMKLWSQTIPDILAEPTHEPDEL